jgi:hypothetical protein
MEAQANKSFEIFCFPSKESYICHQLLNKKWIAEHTNSALRYGFLSFCAA